MTWAAEEAAQQGRGWPARGPAELAGSGRQRSEVRGGGRAAWTVRGRRCTGEHRRGWAQLQRAVAGGTGHEIRKKIYRDEEESEVDLGVVLLTYFSHRGG